MLRRFVTILIIIVLFCLPEFPLDLSFDLLALALQLLRRIAGGAADGATDTAFHLLGCAFELILGALSGWIFSLCHGAPRVRVSRAGATLTLPNRSGREGDH